MRRSAGAVGDPLPIGHRGQPHQPAADPSVRRRLLGSSGNAGCDAVGDHGAAPRTAPPAAPRPPPPREMRRPLNTPTRLRPAVPEPLMWRAEPAEHHACPVAPVVVAGDAGCRRTRSAAPGGPSLAPA